MVVEEDTEAMKKMGLKLLTFISLLLLLLTCSLRAEAKECKPSGKIKGKKPPPKKCNRENYSDCCQHGELYTIFHCSPPVSKRTRAVLTLNSFQKGGDGGGRSECDGKFHDDNTPIVALSTGWFNKKKRCFHNITIYGNGRNVKAMVVDECDSSVGCDEQHDYQPPCPNNVVDASKAVWKVLHVPKNKWGLWRASCERAANFVRLVIVWVD
ncbi:hypothetical protein K2173_025432 [Erythroxylum novogranatense]|uniref:Ripening-related protein 1 n=1 Tax=Erythroxylum novogranatense TaxID=1862640 RepID=A0AAV8UDT1_9ROSI|nr:hypothetical protein K2173_025432 [Erythroxylum novogranatense]